MSNTLNISSVSKASFLPFADIAVNLILSLLVVLQIGCLRSSYDVTVVSSEVEGVEFPLPDFVNRDRQEVRERVEPGRPGETGGVDNGGCSTVDSEFV